jgi:hypothetical protein
MQSLSNPSGRRQFLTNAESSSQSAGAISTRSGGTPKSFRFPRVQCQGAERLTSDTVIMVIKALLTI